VDVHSAQLTISEIDSGLKPEEYPARPTGSASRAEGDMNIPHALFLWREAYIRAVCETDDSLMMSRIYEARAAIEQRRLTPLRMRTNSLPR